MMSFGCIDLITLKMNDHPRSVFFFGEPERDLFDPFEFLELFELFDREDFFLPLKLAILSLPLLFFLFFSTFTG
jgi:hypothetical protein